MAATVECFLQKYTLTSAVVILSVGAMTLLVDGIMMSIFVNLWKGAQAILGALLLSSMAVFFYFLSLIKE